jgi:hypothetical protein
MNKLTQILAYLQGRKTTIATILGALITFSLARGYIASDVAELLATILLALGLSINIATAKLVK